MQKITYKQFTDALIIINRYASENEIVLNSQEKQLEISRNTPVSIFENGLNVRTFRVLNALFDDPKEITPKRISDFSMTFFKQRKNCGPKTISEIKELLESVNLTFKK